MEIPLIIYKKNSKLENLIPESGWNSDRQLINLDISPSIAAVLGIPVPRQSFGHFIDEIIMFANKSNLGNHYQDLYRQRKAFLKLYFNASGSPLSEEEISVLDFYANDTNAPQALQFYQENVKSLMVRIHEERNALFGSQISRNVITVTLISFFIWLVYSVLVHNYTICQPLRLLGKRPQRLNDSYERRAFAISFLKICLFYLFGLSAFALVNRFMLRGYSNW